MEDWNGGNILLLTNLYGSSRMTYTPFVFFGYEIQLPSDMNVHQSIPMMYDLNGMVPTPFEIKSILPTFYPLMNEEEYARVIIGFCPEELDDTVDQANTLAEFVQDNPIFDGMDMAHVPQFYCGIEWCPDPESESSDQSDSFDSSDSESDSDDSKSDSMSI